jgi:hypothetical protein
MDETTEREWRCSSCGTLLGLERRGRLHLKYKTAQYIVQGLVMAVCRRCASISETGPKYAGVNAASGTAA